MLVDNFYCALLHALTNKVSKNPLCATKLGTGSHVSMLPHIVLVSVAPVLTLREAKMLSMNAFCLHAVCVCISFFVSFIKRSIVRNFLGLIGFLTYVHVHHELLLKNVKLNEETICSANSFAIF